MKIRKIQNQLISIIMTIVMFIVLLSQISFAENENKLNNIIEFENASINKSVLRVKSESASNGMYCLYEGTDCVSSDDIKEDDFSWVFNFENSSRVKLYVRAYFDLLSKASFYYRWDNNEWKEYNANVTEDFIWFDIGTDNLVKGKHKLQITHKSAGGLFDAVYVTAEENEPPEIQGVVPMPIKENKSAEKVISQVQKKVAVVSGEGAVLEIEDASLEDKMSKIKSADASKGTAVYAGNTNPERLIPEAGSTAAIEYKFQTEQSGKYIIWARMYFPNSGADSFFYSISDDRYRSPYVAVSTSYEWYKLATVEFEAGKTETLKFEPREYGWSVDQVVITNDLLYMPNGIVKEIARTSTSMKQIYDNPPINPPSNQHPRVYFRENDIPELKTRLDHPENEVMKNRFSDLVKTEIIKDGDTAVVQAKAYYYALYNDEKYGREAIEAAKKFIECEYTMADKTRAYGRLICTIGMVYDWCYDLMTDEDKEYLISVAAAKGSQMEIGWPPVIQGAVADHGCEAQLLKDYMAFAIAVYDENPDIWNLVGGRFYQEYVPVRKFVHPAGLPHQGADYGTYRHVFDEYAYMLITGMGAEEPYSGEEMTKSGYGWELYLRRTDGSKMYDGDVYSADQMSSTNENQTGAAILAAAVSKNPYLEDQMFREVVRSDKNGLVYGSGELSVVEWLIMHDPTVERKSIYSLPLSRYFGSPIGAMAARTGWSDGVDSPAVIAMMKIGEYNFANHNHKDAGNFILYYKGTLASESGMYQDYGSIPHYSYTKQTIAHNSILVYDPKESLNNFYRNVNDGGQRNANEYTTLDGLLNGNAKVAEVLGQEIDPKHSGEPEYTYLKGDLTNAYSDKIKEFKRSFMFLNLFDEKVPGALIVFDKVTSSNPSFKKTWLLHGQSYPEINGNRTTWYTNKFESGNGYTYQGKMVVDTLLPKANNTEFNVVGGPEEGWNIINGVDYKYPNQLETREESAYRLEVSPKASGNTDYFLNVLQVSDAGENYYKNAEMIDIEKYYGVKISDRVVMFSKSGERAKSALNIKIPNLSGTYKFTVCDVEAGVWEVECGGQKFDAVVTQDGGVLAFTGVSGEIDAHLVSDSYDEIIQAADDNSLTEKDTDDTIYVKYANNFAYMPEKPIIKNGKLMVPMSDIIKQMELKTEQKFVNLNLTDEEQNLTAALSLNSSKMITDTGVVDFVNSVFEKNGEWYVELRPFAEYFNHHVYWNEYAKTAYIFPDKKISLKTEEGYVSIASVKPDPNGIDGTNYASNVIDGKLDTIWAAAGEGRYIDIELTQEEVLENVEIIFNPNNNRTPFFEIQISDDGVNYRTVYSGVGDSMADGLKWEVFNFNIRTSVKTKHIRYVANKSNISEWNAVKEIRFKRGKELIVWDKAENSAEIETVTPDTGNIDGDNVVANLVDSMNKTIWAAEGIGRYAEFKLTEETELSAVEIVFNPNNKRKAKFEIQVSEDGRKYTTIYSGVSDGNAGENDWQTFTFDKPVKARYIRYVGNGSNISRWNGVREIRFIKK